MALGEVFLPQGFQHRLAVAQQPQLVCDSALTLAQQSGSLLLAHAAQLHELLDAAGFLDKVQVLPLQIFHQGGKAGFPVVHLHDNAGNLGKPCQHGSPQPPLSGYQLIARAHPAHGQGLQNAVLTDGACQL